MKNPSWWNEKHDGAWERTKSALKRDWEQTKSDFGVDSARDLDQGADDTVKQAAGKEPIPPGKQPNASKWEDVEHHYRYAAGAREQYGDDWDEARLSKDWSQVDDKSKWEDVKGTVRRAWDKVTK